MPRNSLSLVLGALGSVGVDGPRMVDPSQSQSSLTMRTSGAVEVSESRGRPTLHVLRGHSTMRGRRRGRRVLTAAELYLDREMQTAFVSWAGRTGTVPSEAVQKIREGLQHPWRVLARRFVEAHAAGVPLPIVLRIVRTLESWLRQLYDTTGETVTEQVTYYQSPRWSGPFTRVA